MAEDSTSVVFARAVFLDRPNHVCPFGGSTYRGSDHVSQNRCQGLRICLGIGPVAVLMEALNGSMAC